MHCTINEAGQQKSMQLMKLSCMQAERCVGLASEQPDANLILCASERLSQKVSDILTMIGVYQPQCVQGASFRVWTS